MTNEEIAACADLSIKTKAQYVIENFIKPSWLGEETDDNQISAYAKKVADALDSIGLLVADR